MLNKRIRYEKISDHLQTTTYNYVCNKMVCKGYFDSNEGMWYIINLVNNKKILFGYTKIEDNAKQMIKKSLKSLGANFLDEVRSTKNNPSPMLTAEVIDEIVREKEGK